MGHVYSICITLDFNKMRNTVYLMLIFWKVWQAFAFQGLLMVTKVDGEGTKILHNNTNITKNWKLLFLDLLISYYVKFK